LQIGTKKNQKEKQKKECGKWKKYFAGSFIFC